MRKIILLLSLLSTAAQADYTIVNPSRPHNPASWVASTIGMDLGVEVKYDHSAVDFVAKKRKSSCEDSIKTFNSTPDSIMVYTTAFAMESIADNLQCDLRDATPENTLLITKHYFSLCQSEGSKNFIFDNNIGIPYAYATPKHSQEYKKFSSSSKLIGVFGSSDVISGIISGKYNSGYIASFQASDRTLWYGDDLRGELSCPYSTNPNLSNFIGKQFDLHVPDFHVDYVVYTNIKDPQKINSLRKLISSDGSETMKLLSKFNYVTEKNINSNSLNSIYQYIDKMIYYWGNSNKLDVEVK
jgi:hypothetical protein